LNSILELLAISTVRVVNQLPFTLVTESATLSTPSFRWTLEHIDGVTTARLTGEPSRLRALTEALANIHCDTQKPVVEVNSERSTVEVQLQGHYVSLAQLVAKRGALAFPDQLAWIPVVSRWLEQMPETLSADSSSLLLRDDLTSVVLLPCAEEMLGGPRVPRLQLLARLLFESVKGFPANDLIRADDCIGLPAALKVALPIPFQPASAVTTAEWLEMLAMPVTMSVSPERASLEGQQVGGYLVHERIGEGGMGDVYRATHVHLQTPVALKFLRADLAGDPQFVQRFFAEARLAHALKHPNIVAVSDFVRAPPHVFFAMEYLQGISLKSLLERDKTPALPLTRKWMREVCLALSTAHRAGVVHRDIKPENIFLVQTSEGYRAKLLDFGIAKVARGTGSFKTEVGSVVGTLKYMSPEQALGREVDARTDLYAVGAVFYEMLTGVAVSDATRPLGRLERTSSGERVPPALSTAILQTLSLEASQRPGRVEAILQALDESESALIRNKNSASSWALAMAALVVLSLIAASVVKASNATPEPETPPVAVSEPKSVPSETPPVPPDVARPAPTEPKTVAPGVAIERKEKKAAARKRDEGRPALVEGVADDLKRRLARINSRLASLEADFGEGQVTTLERAVILQARRDFEAGRLDSLSETLKDAESAVSAAEKRLRP
jgi:serine/threonine protein kinase